MWLRDTGVLEKLKHDVARELGGKCLWHGLPCFSIPDPIVRDKKPLNFKQLAIIVIVQFVGLAIGTLVFFIELCKRPKPRTKKAKNKIEARERLKEVELQVSI